MHNKKSEIDFLLCLRNHLTCVHSYYNVSNGCNTHSNCQQKTHQLGVGSCQCTSLSWYIWVGMYHNYTQHLATTNMIVPNNVTILNLIIIFLKIYALSPTHNRQFGGLNVWCIPHTPVGRFTAFIFATNSSDKNLFNYQQMQQ